jgi:hypothetical protein
VKYISKIWKKLRKSSFFVTIASLIAATAFAQPLPTPPETSAQKARNQLVKACEANFSGSTNQADDCLLCAKKVSDINSRKFNSCMSSGADLYLPSIDDPLEELVPKKKK